MLKPFRSIETVPPTTINPIKHEPPHGAGADYDCTYTGGLDLGNNAETYLSVVVTVMDSEQLFMEVFRI